MRLLRTTALVDVPVRVVSAVLTERALFGGDGVLAPGDELAIGGGRVRVAELGVGGLRSFRSAGRRPSGCRSAGADPAGVLVTATAAARTPLLGMVARRQLLDLLTSTVDCVGARAVGLAERRVVVGTAIVRGRCRCSRSSGPIRPPRPGRWELPGGRVEPGESDVDAVRRECREELGVDVRVGGAIGPDVALGKDSGGKLLLRMYRAELADPRAVPHPHDHAGPPLADRRPSSAASTGCRPTGCSCPCCATCHAESGCCERPLTRHPQDAAPSPARCAAAFGRDARRRRPRGCGPAPPGRRAARGCARGSGAAPRSPPR